MNQLFKRALTSAAVVSTVAGSASAQLGLPDPVFLTRTAVDATVPDAAGTILTFTLLGADGGQASIVTQSNEFCVKPGGQGGTATIDVVIGYEDGQLRPGGTIRYIVGERGGNGFNPPAFSATFATAAGAGGGGTGLLYRESTDFEILAVSGGGGGAYSQRGLSTCSAPNGDGDNAQTGQCGGNGGSDGGAGGCNAEAGAGFDGGGGGGGAFGSATGTEGGSAGFPEGGSGGIGTDSIGGWGFGGGGGGEDDFFDSADGGGGGGYSGGGGGDTFGGSGGSFINFSYSIDHSLGRTSFGFEDGIIRTALKGQIHDERSGAVALSASRPMVTGSMIGATPSGLDSCNSNSPLNDVWYSYTNISNTTELLDVAPVAGIATLALVDAFGNCLQTSTIGITQELLPGGRVFVGVLSGADTIQMSVAVQTDLNSNGIPDNLEDCDGDGVPNDLDQAVDITNATAFPTEAVDIDSTQGVTISTCGILTDFDTQLVLW